jgi:hypothetical protein
VRASYERRPSGALAAEPGDVLFQQLPPGTLVERARMPDDFPGIFRDHTAGFEADVVMLVGYSRHEGRQQLQHRSAPARQ